MRLEKNARELADDLAKAQECLQYFKLNYKSDYMAKDPPLGLEGQVTDARRPDLVEISVGADDGLRQGHKLEVVRTTGGVTSYVGRIEVTNTTSGPRRLPSRPGHAPQPHPTR